MGSLMSGWNSTVLTDDKKVRMMRNRSLTKEEVEAFWRQHGRPDYSGQPGRSPLGSPRVVSPLPSPRRSDDEEVPPPFEARRLDAIRSLPSSPLARGGQHFSSRSEPSSPATQRAEGSHESGAAGSPIITSCDWWTRSSWAFLNEPPHKLEETSGVSGRDREHKFAVPRILTGNA